MELMVYKMCHFIGCITPYCQCGKNMLDQQFISSKVCTVQLFKFKVRLCTALYLIMSDSILDWTPSWTGTVNPSSLLIAKQER